MAIRVKDLQNIARKGPQPFLYCPKCGERNSATHGDYFMLAPNTVFKHCGRNMKLMLQETRLIQVSVEELFGCEICGEPAGEGGALCPVHLREAGIK